MQPEKPRIITIFLVLSRAYYAFLNNYVEYSVFSSYYLNYLIAHFSLKSVQDGGGMHFIEALIFNSSGFNLPDGVKMPEYPDNPFRFQFQQNDLQPLYFESQQVYLTEHNQLHLQVFYRQPVSLVSR